MRSGPPVFRVEREEREKSEMDAFFIKGCKVETHG